MLLTSSSCKIILKSMCLRVGWRWVWHTYLAHISLGRMNVMFCVSLLGILPVHCSPVWRRRVTSLAYTRPLQEYWNIINKMKTNKVLIHRGEFSLLLCSKEKSGCRSEDAWTGHLLKGGLLIVASLLDPECCCPAIDPETKSSPCVHDVIRNGPRIVF